MNQSELKIEPLHTASSLLKYVHQEVLIHGSIPGNPKDLLLRAYFQTFDTPDWFPQQVKTIQPMLEFDDSQGSVALAVSIMLQFEGNPSPLEFQGRMDVKLGRKKNTARVYPEEREKKHIDFKISGSMIGTWQNALGIKGFDITSLSLTFAPLWNTLIFSNTVQFGSRIISVSAAPPISWLVSFSAIRAKINELNLDDLVIVLNNMNIKVRHEQFPLPQVGLRDVDLMVSTVEDANTGLYPGFHIDGRMVFNGDDVAKVYVRSWKLGIIVKGECVPLTIGPLKITGAQADKGPLIDAAMKPGALHYRYEGNVDLFVMSRGVQIFQSKDRIMLELTGKTFDLYETFFRIDGSLDYKKPAFVIEAVMKADFINAITEAIEKASAGKIPAFVEKYVSKAFEVREAGFKGSLDACMGGNVPGFWLKYRCLGKSYEISTVFNLKDVKPAIEKFGGDTAKEIIAKLEAYAKLMEEKVKAAVKEIKAKIAQAVAKALEDIKAWFKKNKKDSGPTQRSVDVRYVSYAVYYW